MFSFIFDALMQSSALHCPRATSIFSLAASQKAMNPTPPSNFSLYWPGCHFSTRHVRVRSWTAAVPGESCCTTCPKCYLIPSYIFFLPCCCWTLCCYRIKCGVSTLAIKKKKTRHKKTDPSFDLLLVFSFHRLVLPSREIFQVESPAIRPAS